MDTTNRIVKANIENMIEQYIIMLRVAQHFTTRMTIKAAKIAEIVQKFEI
jgi:hypothetical protein